MTMTFYLVRHALKEKAIGDVPITANGRIQAELTARRLAQMPITAVVASPLRRARETAEAISLTTNASLRVDRRLRERANWGDLPGQTFEEFVAMWNRCTQEPDYIPPVGDSAKQAAERLASLLQDLSKEYPEDSSLVVVTHGGLITDFLVQAFTDQELNVWHPHFRSQQSELVAECSITKLTYKGGTFQLIDFASTSHLTT
ncbi:histidine phosphatase family protein [Paenibacillus senegalensis]|uniref:histidine phosphatase family protein n=1 Tax=Paenibacillus senegalensis TaxID=1465766 RepID=UPI000288E665|nr:histidine phosphatase family protein [Paenibacillus senegalensis]